MVSLYYHLLVVHCIAFKATSGSVSSPLARRGDFQTSWSAVHLRRMVKASWFYRNSRTTLCSTRTPGVLESPTFLRATYVSAASKPPFGTGLPCHGSRVFGILGFQGFRVLGGRGIRQALLSSSQPFAFFPPAAVRDSKEGLAWDGGLDQFLVKREASAPPDMRTREVKRSNALVRP